VARKEFGQPGSLARGHGVVITIQAEKGGPMNEEGSVTRIIHQVKEGEEVACQQLWERYFRHLVALARARLGKVPRQAGDEEDVALSVLDSVIRRAGEGRFPLLVDRHDLWSLLVVITRRKAANLVRYDEARQPRDGRNLHVSALETSKEADGELLASLIGEEPDPAFAAEMAEECGRLLGLLQDAILRSVALSKMEGYTNKEIARRLGLAEPTVERKLVRIRATWAGEVPSGKVE
jgi:DNA-directed RNA polymerase specialized sigma24 family protein